MNVSFHQGVATLQLHQIPDVQHAARIAELGLQENGNVVLPGEDSVCIDAARYCNITSFINDSRSILQRKRLKDNFTFLEVRNPTKRENCRVCTPGALIYTQMYVL